VLTKWHITLDIAIYLGAVVVFFFAILVLYVLTHSYANQISKLKSTIRRQHKALRKLRKKQQEVRNQLGIKGLGGLNAVEVEESMEEVGYGTIDKQIVINKAKLKRMR
jgi:hypothetical protein